MDENTVLQSLGRIEGGLEALKERFVAHTQQEELRMTAMSTDITAIKDTVSRAKGAKTLLSWLVGIFIGGYALVHGWLAK